MWHVIQKTHLFITWDSLFKFFCENISVYRRVWRISVCMSVSPNLSLGSLNLISKKGWEDHSYIVWFLNPLLYSLICMPVPQVKYMQNLLKSGWGEVSELFKRSVLTLIDPVLGMKTSIFVKASLKKRSLSFRVWLRDIDISLFWKR
jgi:hypothetical protein